MRGVMERADELWHEYWGIGGREVEVRADCSWWHVAARTLLPAVEN
jgi:hypothetical protein